MSVGRHVKFVVAEVDYRIRRVTWLEFGIVDFYVFRHSVERWTGC